MQISFGFDMAFARQRNNLVDAINPEAKAAPGAVGFQPSEKGLAPLNQMLFAQTVVLHFSSSEDTKFIYRICVQTKNI